MDNNQVDGKPYYVVRFIEIPFDGIHNCVCVPRSWIIWSIADKVAVAYPNDEDPFDTRDRVKRNERRNEQWMLYMAEVIYKADTYRDAEYWIESRNDYRPWFEKDPRRKAAQPEPTSDNKLPSGSRNQPSKSTRDKPQLTPKIIENLSKLPAKMSRKRAAQSEAAAQLNEERRRQNNAVRPPGSAGIHLNMPWCPKREKSIVIRERDQTEAAAASCSDKPTPSQLTDGNRHRSSPVRPAKKQLPSLPIIDLDDISIDEGPSKGERQPSKSNSNSQSQRASNKTTALMAPPQPPTSVEQPPHHRQHSKDRENSHSNFQPIITEVRSIRETDNEQKPRTDGIPSNEPYASHHQPSSSFLKMSAQLYSQMNESPSLIPMHKPVEMRIRLANPSNLMNQNRSSSPQRPEPTVTQNPSQNINTTHFRIKIGKSENIENVATATQHTPSLPHERPSFVRKERNSLLKEQYQQQPMDVPDALQRSSGSHSIAQKLTSLEKISMHKASTEQRLPNLAANQPNAGAPQFYPNNPGNFHQEKRQELSRTPTEGINPAQPTHLMSRNIAHQTITSSDYLQQRQPSQYHRHAQQQCPSEPQVRAPTNASNDRRLSTVQRVTQKSPPNVQPSIPDSTRQKMFRDYLLNLQRLERRLQGKTIAHDPGSRVSSQNVILASNIVNPSTARSPPRSADHVRQTDKRMEVDPDQGSSSDPEVVDPGVILEQELFTNNADGAGTSDAQGSATANNQLHTRMVLEQQMIDNFSTIFTQMGSTLYYLCEMSKNLRSSILETADTYKQLLEVAQRSNALGAAESAASFSSNVAPGILSLNEDRQTRATKREYSSNHNQYSSRVDEEQPNTKRKMRWKVILPAEYDPKDTGWTLKYRKMVPGLQELVQGRGIYVNYSNLKIAEQKSVSCRTLASLLLEEVFSETALMLCSAWLETESWIERPPLDPAAWNALISYVIWYGSVYDWNTDTGEIIKAMDDKIYQIRARRPSES